MALGAALAGSAAGRRPGEFRHASTTNGPAADRRARQFYGDRFILDETSLGPEWYLDPGSADDPPLGGFTTGLNEAETVTHINAGDICAAR